MVSATFRETHLGRFADAVVQNSVPMQRGARLAISPNAPMQRGARFVILEVPFGVPCWVKSGRQKRYKTNAFLLIFKIKGRRMRPPEEQNHQNVLEK